MPIADGRWAPHVTVATIVSNGNQVLLVSENIAGRTVLNQPAGHLEPGESLQQAALRETLEETGWEVELTGLVGIYQWTAPDGSAFQRFTFAARPLQQRHDGPLDAAIEQALWLAPELLAGHSGLRSPLVAHCVAQWQAGALYPLSVLEVVS
ncbi:7,8-dihydro-8-oxoguanine-triphosphatase [Stenotrophomonas ginsengisoli]|uniref:Phosphatase NudJ n=1 Tax=Stenotrophomonas ginsengisoli TaxID=336566 RepID=A0A0R0D9F4_9GAMM|nr:NUDIX hydrolase [Stenotrophomonas ginsengisoli]KRG78895.1 7,8-dihydro-8-oxoguanine-triphosphatase [Stenotrophomonas ginsengisoli]